MESERQSGSDGPQPADASFVEMPRATAAPVVLAAGLVLAAAGLVFGWAMTIVGVVLLFTGLGMWIANLASSRGHFHEELVAESDRPRPVRASHGKVERLATGMPGYRVQLPQQVHPISAGIKGGLIGGLVLPVPALFYGLLSGHGIWYPVNLLAGMALPGIGRLSVAELQKFHESYLIAAVFIHVATSLVAGLAYGVLLPMLPEIPKPLAWGGLLMPVLWTAVSFALLKMTSTLYEHLDWPSFVLSQFVFGVVAALVVMRWHKLPPLASGLLGGIVGGAVMVIPAVAWAWVSGHGIWYPANVLAGMLDSKIGRLPASAFAALSWRLDRLCGDDSRGDVDRVRNRVWVSAAAAAEDSRPDGLGSVADAFGLDGGELWADGRGQSDLAAACRLAVVRGLAIHFRRGGVDRGRAVGVDQRAAGRAGADRFVAVVSGRRDLLLTMTFDNRT